MTALRLEADILQTCRYRNSWPRTARCSTDVSAATVRQLPLHDGQGEWNRIGFNAKGHDMAKNTLVLCFNKDARAAGRFYAEPFAGSAVGAVHRAPSDYPSGKEGDALVVEFKVAGVPCIGLNGGPAFKHSEAFSFQIATDNQEE